YERWMRPYADQWADSLLRLADTVEQPEKGSVMSNTTALPLASLDIAQETRVAAPREKVFDALCKMGDWWPHRFHDQSRVHFEPAVGGRFWEEWAEGGALYATVDRIRRPELLECTGPMGMTGPVLGMFTLTLEEDGEQTVLKLTHRAYGDIDEETRIGYTEGWGEIVNVLNSYLGLAG
ncbi:MAG TPA: SRPBCC domain-containing protein, partial [Actinomycetes bacterium]|nr:SRPBCC domain-containing protein [Actinomycetes bacterium]